MSGKVGTKVELRGYDRDQRERILRSLEMLNRTGYRRFYKSGLRTNHGGIHAEITGDAVTVIFWREKTGLEKVTAPVVRGYRLAREAALRRIGKSELVPKRTRWKALAAARPQAPADPFSRDVR